MCEFSIGVVSMKSEWRKSARENEVRGQKGEEEDTSLLLLG